MSNNNLTDERLNALIRVARDSLELYEMELPVIDDVMLALAELQQRRAAMLQAGNHTEQHLDMVVHSGDAKEKVDCRLPFDQWLSQQNEPIDVDCGCVTTEAFYHWLRVAYEAGNSPMWIGVDWAKGCDPGNSPATPDGWVMVSERMPDKLIPVIVMYEDGEMWSAMWNGNRWDDGTEYPDPHAVTHWREMPETPQQE